MSKTYSFLILTKGKPGLKESIDFLRRMGHGVDCIVGDIGDPWPHDCFDKWSGDFLVSYLSAWIIPPHALHRARIASINFHPGPPEYPGIGCTNFALYHNEKTFGVVAHHMAERVDTGPLIAVKRFSVLPGDTVASLGQRCYQQIERLFQSVFLRYFEKGELPKSQETWKRVPYKRSELEELCRIETEMETKEIQRRIRATYFPEKPGPYVQIGDSYFEYVDQRSSVSQRREYQQKAAKDLSPIVIAGAGGHTKVLMDLIAALNKYRVIGVTDIKSGDHPCVSPDAFVLGTDEILPRLFKENTRLAAVGLGSVKDTKPRRLLREKLENFGFDLPPLVHPKAVVAQDVILGRGCQVMAGSVVNTGAKLGVNCVINTGAIVEHDCHIGDDAFVGPRACLGGNVIVGEGAFIGLGSTVLQGVRIGARTVVGAGAVVIRNVPADQTVVGIPAASLKYA